MRNNCRALVGVKAKHRQYQRSVGAQDEKIPRRSGSPRAPGEGRQELPKANPTLCCPCRRELSSPPSNSSPSAVGTAQPPGEESTVRGQALLPHSLRGAEV